MLSPAILPIRLNSRPLFCLMVILLDSGSSGLCELFSWRRNCLVYLGHEAQWALRPCRLDRREDVSTRRQIEPSGTRRWMLHVHKRFTSEILLFLPLPFFALGEYNFILPNPEWNDGESGGAPYSNRDRAGYWYWSAGLLMKMNDVDNGPSWIIVTTQVLFQENHQTQQVQQRIHIFVLKICFFFDLDLLDQGCDSRFRGIPARGLKNSLRVVFTRHLRGIFTVIELFRRVFGAVVTKALLDARRRNPFY